MADSGIQREAVVEALGYRGEGQVRFEDGRTAYVRGVLAGERVSVVCTRNGDATLRSILERSAHRIAPVCPHFGVCGGCVAQHMDQETYLAWRASQIEATLEQRGIRTRIEQVLVVHAAARRRATLAWRNRRGRCETGFRVRAGRDVVDLEACPVLHPSLGGLIQPLRTLARTLGGSGRYDLTLCDNGFDLVVESGTVPDMELREALTAFAMSHDAARLSWRGGQGDLAEIIVERRRPLLSFGGIAVAPPPGVFLQPTGEGERHLQQLVLEMVEDRTSVADLFSGCGTLSLPLALRTRVAAFDLDSPSIDALQAAAGRAGGSGQSVRLSAEVRDLFRRPLQGGELSSFDAVVFDPPRAGAAAQAAALAESGVPVVVAVSCNPATFARDARLLVDGGYTLERVVPIDQFVWSHHVEVVALFRR